MEALLGPGRHNVFVKMEHELRFHKTRHSRNAVIPACARLAATMVRGASDAYRQRVLEGGVGLLELLGAWMQHVVDAQIVVPIASLYPAFAFGDAFSRAGRASPQLSDQFKAGYCFATSRSYGELAKNARPRDFKYLRQAKYAFCLDGTSSLDAQVCSDSCVLVFETCVARVASAGTAAPGRWALAFRF